jgi:hypothetical protein
LAGVVCPGTGSSLTNPSGRYRDKPCRQTSGINLC